MYDFSLGVKMFTKYCKLLWVEIIIFDMYLIYLIYSCWVTYGCISYPWSLICAFLFHSIRIGFVSGPKAILEKVNFHMQASVLHTSGVSQVNNANISNFFLEWKITHFCAAISALLETHVSFVAT